MKSSSTDPSQAEQTLTREYMELMGAGELSARSVYMFAIGDKDEEAVVPRDKVAAASPASGAPAAGAGLTAVWVAGLSFLATLGSLQAEPMSTNTLFSSPLSLADAVNIAMRQNPNIQRAQKDLQAAHGVSIQTRAIAVPKVNVSGSYNAMQHSDADIAQIPLSPNSTFTVGNDQNWSSQVKLVQSLYEGGRILSSLRAARLTGEQALLNYQTAVADAVANVQVSYYDVLLAQQQIVVQQASVELLTSELTDTTRRYNAGTVPRFNVLRAEVELANARPRLIQASNSFRIAKNDLSNQLGYRVPRQMDEDIPLKLSGRLEAVPYQMNLSRALVLALDQRSELGALRKAEALRREDIVNARAGYLPRLQAYGGYDAHNSAYSQDLDYEDHGWITGVTLNWDIFDGLVTRGKVVQATALHDRAMVDVDDAVRRVELEVRTAFSNFREADEVLRSEKKVVEEAEEALRLATARSDAGTGTQLDVLSAQTALTEARTTQIQALHDYAAARVRLERAVGDTVPNPKL